VRESEAAEHCFLVDAGVYAGPRPHPLNSIRRTRSGPHYAADLAGTRYRPLDQINAPISAIWKLPAHKTTISATARVQAQRHAAHGYGVLYALRDRARRDALTGHGGIALDPLASNEESAGGAAPGSFRPGLAYWSDARKSESFM